MSERVERKVQLQREVDLKEIHAEVPSISDPNKTVRVHEHFRGLPKRVEPEPEAEETQ